MKDTIEISTAAEINRLHAELCSIAKVTIEKAIHIGELLLEEKAKLKHGGWLKWVEANLEFDERTARRYTDLCRNQEYLKTDTVSDLTSGYRLLTNRRKAIQIREQAKAEHAAKVANWSQRVVHDPNFIPPAPRPPPTAEEIEAANRQRVMTGFYEYVDLTSREVAVPADKVCEWVLDNLLTRSQAQKEINIGLFRGIRVKLELSEKEFKLLNRALNSQSAPNEIEKALITFGLSLRTRCSSIQRFLGTDKAA